MTIFLFTIVIFLGLIQWVVFIDVILSWGSLVGIRFRPVWIQKIIVPLYAIVRRFIPTTAGGMDFTPLIIFILIELLTSVIFKIDPSIMGFLSR
ncbi:MAG: YggT family protein [Candidatus Gracilibacteria bacterium]|nr:YggT family protein [Candidatus Gracilibacteria bacterium]